MAYCTNKYLLGIFLQITRCVPYQHNSRLVATEPDTTCNTSAVWRATQTGWDNSSAPAHVVFTKYFTVIKCSNLSTYSFSCENGKKIKRERERDREGETERERVHPVLWVNEICMRVPGPQWNPQQSWHIICVVRAQFWESVKGIQWARVAPTHIHAEINAYKAVCSNIYKDKAEATCERRIKLLKLPKCESEARG